jgi:hypothetical protein
VLAGLYCPWVDVAVGQMRAEGGSVADIADDLDFSSEGLDEDEIEQLQGVAPLAPNEPLRPSATPAAPEAAGSAREMLGPPTLASMSAGRGRARLLSRGRQTAPPMLGDFFGGSPGTPVQILGNSIGLAGTVQNQAILEGLKLGPANQPIPLTTFYGPFSGGGLKNIPGAVVNSGGLVQSAPGLVLVDFVGKPLSTAANQTTFTALSTGQSLLTSSGFDPNSPIFAIHPALMNVFLPNASSSGAGLVGITKIAENTSPMPRDRVFFNYSAFSGVPLTMNGVNVSRFTPGFEKTFFDRSMSVEMRFPFASTASNTIVADGNTSTGNVLFGDMSLTGKALLYTDDVLAVSTGLQLTLPTAGALDVRLSDGTDLVRIANDSVYLMPFLGALYTPDDRFFTQGFLQFDAAANGNRVSVNNNFNGGPLAAAGSLRDVPYVFIDIGSGYWLYRNDEGSGLTGFSATAELHYNGSLDATSILNTGTYQIGSIANSIEMLTGVVGGHLYFNRNTSLTVGYSFPIGNSADQMFKGELRAFLNYNFGSPTFRAPPSI